MIDSDPWAALQSALIASPAVPVPPAPSLVPVFSALSAFRANLYPLQALGPSAPCRPLWADILACSKSLLATAVAAAAGARPTLSLHDSNVLRTTVAEVVGVLAVCMSRELAVESFAALCCGRGALCWERALQSLRVGVPPTAPSPAVSTRALEAALSRHQVYKEQCSVIAGMCDPPLPLPPLTLDAECLLATVRLILRLRQGCSKATPPHTLEAATSAALESMPALLQQSSLVPSTHTSFLCHAWGLLQPHPSTTTNAAPPPILAMCCAEELASYALLADVGELRRLSLLCPMNAPPGVLCGAWLALHSCAGAVEQGFSPWRAAAQAEAGGNAVHGIIAVVTLWGRACAKNPLPTLLLCAAAHAAVARLRETLAVSALSGRSGGTLHPPLGLPPSSWPAELASLDSAIQSAQEAVGRAGMDCCSPFFKSAWLVASLRACVLGSSAAGGLLGGALETICAAPQGVDEDPLHTLEVLLCATVAKAQMGEEGRGGNPIAHCAATLRRLLVDLGCEGAAAAFDTPARGEGDIFLTDIPSPLLDEVLLLFSVLILHRTAQCLCSAIGGGAAAAAAATAPLASALESAHAAITLLPGVLRSASCAAAAGVGGGGTARAAAEAGHPACLPPSSTLTSLTRLGGYMLSLRVALANAKGVTVMTPMPWGATGAASTAEATYSAIEEALAGVERALETLGGVGTGGGLPLALAASLPLHTVHSAEREVQGARAFVAVERAHATLALCVERLGPTGIAPLQSGNGLMLEWPVAAQGRAHRGFIETLCATLDGEAVRAGYGFIDGRSGGDDPELGKKLTGLCETARVLVRSCSATLELLSPPLLLQQQLQSAPIAPVFDSAAFACPAHAPKLPALLFISQYALHVYAVRLLGMGLACAGGIQVLPAQGADSTLQRGVGADLSQLSSEPLCTALATVLQALLPPVGEGGGYDPPPLPHPSTLACLKQALLTLSLRALCMAENSGLRCDTLEPYVGQAESSCRGSGDFLSLPPSLALPIERELRMTLRARKSMMGDASLLAAMFEGLGGEGQPEERQHASALRAAAAASMLPAEGSAQGGTSAMEAVFSEEGLPLQVLQVGGAPWSPLTARHLACVALLEVLDRGTAATRGTGCAGGAAWGALQLLLKCSWSVSPLQREDRVRFLFPCGALPAPPSCLMSVLQPPPSAPPPQAAQLSPWEELLQRLGSGRGGGAVLHCASLSLFRSLAYCNLVCVCAAAVPTAVELLVGDIESCDRCNGTTVGSPTAAGEGGGAGAQFHSVMRWLRACLAACGPPQSNYAAPSHLRAQHADLLKTVSALDTLGHCLAAQMEGLWVVAGECLVDASAALGACAGRDSAAHVSPGATPAIALMLSQLVTLAGRSGSAPSLHPSDLQACWTPLWHRCCARLALECILLGHASQGALEGGHLPLGLGGSVHAIPLGTLLAAAGSGWELGRLRSGGALPSQWPTLFTTPSDTLPNPLAVFSRRFQAAVQRAEEEAGVACEGELKTALQAGGGGLEGAKNFVVSRLEQGIVLPRSTLALLHTCRAYALLQEGGGLESRSGANTYFALESSEGRSYGFPEPSPWVEAAGRVLEDSLLAAGCEVAAPGGAQSGDIRRAVALQRLAACGKRVLDLLHARSTLSTSSPSISATTAAGLKAELEGVLVREAQDAASVVHFLAGTAAPRQTAAASSLLSSLIPTAIQVMGMRAAMEEVAGAIEGESLAGNPPILKPAVLSRAESCTRSLQDLLTPCLPWLPSVAFLQAEARGALNYISFLRTLDSLRCTCATACSMDSAAEASGAAKTLDSELGIARLALQGMRGMQEEWERGGALVEADGHSKIHYLATLGVMHTFTSLLHCGEVLQCIASARGSGEGLWCFAQKLGLPLEGRDAALADLLEASLVPASPIFAPSGYTAAATLIQGVRLTTLGERIHAVLTATLLQWWKRGLGRAFSMCEDNEGGEMAASGTAHASWAMQLEAALPILEAYSHSPLLEVSTPLASLCRTLRYTSCTLTPLVQQALDGDTGSGSLSWGFLRDGLAVLCAQQSHPPCLLPRPVHAYAAHAQAVADLQRSLWEIVEQAEATSFQKTSLGGGQSWIALDCDAVTRGLGALMARVGMLERGLPQALLKETLSGCDWRALSLHIPPLFALRQALVAHQQQEGSCTEAALESALAAVASLPAPSHHQLLSAHGRLVVDRLWGVLHKESHHGAHMLKVLGVERGGLLALLSDGRHPCSNPFVSYSALLGGLGDPPSLQSLEASNAQLEKLCQGAQALNCPLSDLGRSMIASAACVLPLRRAFAALVAAWEAHRTPAEAMQGLPIRPVLQALIFSRDTSVPMLEATLLEFEGAAKALEDALFTNALAGLMRSTEEGAGLSAAVECLAEAYGEEGIASLSPIPRVTWEAAWRTASVRQARVQGTPEAMLASLSACEGTPAEVLAASACAGLDEGAAIALYHDLVSLELTRLSSVSEVMAVVGALEAALEGVEGNAGEGGVGLAWAVEGRVGGELLFFTTSFRGRLRQAVDPARLFQQPLALEAAVLEARAVMDKFASSAAGREGQAGAGLHCALEKAARLLPLAGAYTDLRKTALGFRPWWDGKEGLGVLDSDQGGRGGGLLSAGRWAGALLARSEAALSSLSPASPPSEQGGGLAALLREEALFCASHAAVCMSIASLFSEIVAAEEGAATEAAAAAGEDSTRLPLTQLHPSVPCIVLPIPSSVDDPSFSSLHPLAPLEEVFSSLPPFPPLPKFLYLPDTSRAAGGGCAASSARLQAAVAQAAAALELIPQPPSPSSKPPPLAETLRSLLLLQSTLTACRQGLASGDYEACAERAEAFLAQGSCPGAGSALLRDPRWGSTGSYLRAEVEAFASLAQGVVRRTGAVRALAGAEAEVGVGVGVGVGVEVGDAATAEHLLLLLYEAVAVGILADPVLGEEAGLLFQRALGRLVALGRDMAAPGVRVQWQAFPPSRTGRQLHSVSARAGRLG
jgi:hypothetical protein